ncbi:MAG TPA: hypothetical protein VF789_13565 [Thermoanaerobaculia bacterium]
MRELYVVKVSRAVPSFKSKVRRKSPVERVLERLKAERVEDRLRSAPLWRLSRVSGFLRRTRSFPTPEEAALYRDFVESLSKSRGVPVRLKVKGRRVEVVLHGEKTRRGWTPLTDEQLDFAVALS